ncbi:ATP-grasp domain-containing protein [Symbioplanes lichenis]|uniref:ATP-grasp domain-containing protein n=1 Tax=Symbioplanes lichenis TaxID=1629072 RepID=UPI00273908B0|nr:ATP-grasp domain-containing protein [Actinoplanes lichenis]
MMLLVPGDPLRPRRPDEHFAAEAAAAREAGLTVAVIDHDALAGGGDAAAAVARVPAGPDAVYRGWMLRSAHYEAFEAALVARDVTLRTSAAQYRRAHELPGWYEPLAAWTPDTAWTVGQDVGAFEQACTALGGGAAVLRDYSKSLKHHWAEAAFVPDVTDLSTAGKVARRFRELRAEEFTGGFVVRRFEAFTGAEARTWWVGGECRLVTAHPDTPGELPGGVEVPAGLAAAVAGLGLPFVTADLVRHEDGRWRLVELGDGQVSDRPVTCAPADLITALT